MKGPLVVGLGNPLAGDDGIGWHVAERLREHPLLPDGVDVLQTTDLLRLSDTLLDRPLVVLVDALLDDGPCGRFLPIEDLDSLETRAGSVHHLPPGQAIGLLRGLHPELRAVPIILLGVTVQRVCIEHGLSRELALHLDGIATGTLELLARSAARITAS